jgi:hypothetical protein
MSSKRGDSAQCPECGSPLTLKDYGVSYCRSCGYLTKPPDLFERHGVAVVAVASDDPDVEPWTIVNLIDPAVTRAARPLRRLVEKSKRGAVGEPPPALDNLTPTAWKLLRALRDLKALDSEKAATQPRVTDKADTGNHDSKHNQQAFRQLAHLKLIVTRKNVGTWLSDAGIAALNKRSKGG